MMDPAEWTDERERMNRRIDGDMPEHSPSEPIPFGPGWNDKDVDLFNALLEAGVPCDLAASQVDATFMTPEQYAEHHGMFCVA